MARLLKAAQVRSAAGPVDVQETAAAIIAAVRTGGDDAVREWSQKLDGFEGHARSGDVRANRSFGVPLVWAPAAAGDGVTTGRSYSPNGGAS
jgi:hypothetical protein